MFRFSVSVEDAIRVYGRLLEQGLVQDDVFAERYDEKDLGENCRFDLRRELVFRWDDRTPAHLEDARALLSQSIPIAPVRIWLNGREHCWRDETCRAADKGWCPVELIGRTGACTAPLAKD